MNQLLKNSWPPLLCACAASTPAVVQYLLDQGADANTHKGATVPSTHLCLLLLIVHEIPKVGFVLMNSKTCNTKINFLDFDNISLILSLLISCT